MVRNCLATIVANTGTACGVIETSGTFFKKKYAVLFGFVQVFKIGSWTRAARESPKIGTDSNVNNTKFPFHYIGNTILKLKEIKNNINLQNKSGHRASNI